MCNIYTPIMQLTGVTVGIISENVSEDNIRESVGSKPEMCLNTPQYPESQAHAEYCMFCLNAIE